VLLLEVLQAMLLPLVDSSVDLSLGSSNKPKSNSGRHGSRDAYCGKQGLPPSHAPPPLRPLASSTTCPIDSPAPTGCHAYGPKNRSPSKWIMWPADSATLEREAHREQRPWQDVAEERRLLFEKPERGGANAGVVEGRHG
jgi:hypothetical protein